MSLFKTIEASCPICAVPMAFDLVHSVNADRRPDLREQIIARTFQQQHCASCGQVFLPEPEFTLLDMGGRLWLAVWPVSRLDEWAACEQRSVKAFDAFYGRNASGPAQAIGSELRPRVAFGWEAAREKLVALAAGLDDTTLELAKIALLRELDGLGAGDDRELRLMAVDEQGRMEIGVFDSGTGELGETLLVPRALLDEIEAEAEAWQPLREQLGAGPFIDLARLTLATTTA